MSWNNFLLAQPKSSSFASAVAVVSRIPNSMELWFVGQDGSIQGAYWYQGSNWASYELAPAGSASPTGGIAAISRIPSSMELWFVGQNGSIQGAYWYEGNNWARYELAPAGSASLTTAIAALSRIPNSMELWFVGQDGSVQDHFWYEGGNWQNFQLAPSGSASLTTAIAALSRIPNSMELWFVGQDGSVQDHFWYEGGNWQNFQLAPSGSASLTGSIAAVSRIPNSMELWFVGQDGSVQDHFWYEGGNWQNFQLAPSGSASISGSIAAVSRIPNSMELWFVGQDGSVQDQFWYEGANWQNFQLAPSGSASITGGIAVASRVPNSMEVWFVGQDGSVRDNFWYQDPVPAPLLSSGNNNILNNNCQNLRNLTVSLAVSQDLVTYQDVGFSFQLNAYPPPGEHSQGQTLTWFQYIIYVQNGSLYYEIQYWANNAPTSWPNGYTPIPNTTPWLPVLENDFQLISFGSAPSNRISRDSSLTIALSTDSIGNVISSLFKVTDANNNVSESTFQFPQPAQYPIVAFEVNLVGPGNFSSSTFISGAGIITYSVSPGSLSVQSGGPGAACGEWSGGTGEGSNAVYGAVTPPSGSTVDQSLSYYWQGTSAASGSALDGYWGSDSSQHVNFISVDGHVHELYYHPGSANWIDNDLTGERTAHQRRPGVRSMATGAVTAVSTSTSLASTGMCTSCTIIPARPTGSTTI